MSGWHRDKAVSVFLQTLAEAYMAGCLNRQQARTLRGQALAGDMAGARKGLMKLIYREAHAHAETSEAAE